MNYATVMYQGVETLCCVDPAGDRAFLLSDFFQAIGLDQSEQASDMISFIRDYRAEWTEEIAMHFSSRFEAAIPLADLNLLAPIPRPARNIVCLGKNYQAHAAELKGQIFSDNPPSHPIYFTKPDHTVIGPGATILLHEAYTQKVDYEVELAIVIGKTGIDISPEDAEDYIFGYMVANDISARDLQQAHTQWFKGKSLLTHCPLGPYLVHKSMLPLPLSLTLRSYVNGELRQDANTSDLIFNIPAILSDLSRGYELRPGDIILTGTPAGVGMGFDPPRFLKRGDEVICQIEKIGTLINPVEK